ncbi:MAG: carboxypeptidase regulatory-like domain-containing protein [Anaerolineaceae bacterium]|nr:carboxypeptidase regulatory-like domain-containing protein [Anaerolineaceae bacterium]
MIGKQKILGWLISLQFLLCLSACGPIKTEGVAISTPMPTAIRGVVVNEEGMPVSNVVVRVKTTEKYTLTDAEGKFELLNLEAGKPVKVTAWAEGYYISGGEEVLSGSVDVRITLREYHNSDNADYNWLPSTYLPGEGENQGCAQCHSTSGTGLAATLPVDEWLMDTHSLSAHNERFLSMYRGTDLAGNQSPITRYGVSKDYGTFPLLPDPNLPYYGPGYKLDFPESAGNCAACHTPLAAVDDPYGVDPTALTGIESEGISCDFCHKVNDVTINPVSGLPEANMPGVLSFSFLRPPEGHQFFAGPLDDVAPGEDTYTSIQKMSQFCAPCHYGVFWDTVIYNSYGEWLESPYSDTDSGKTCQDCHMPVKGATIFALPEKGGEERDPDTIFSHNMPGAKDKTLLQNAVSMSATTRQEDDVLSVEVTLFNDKTGHDVPTDSPLRQLILLVEARSFDNQALQLIDGPTIPDWGGIGDPSQGYYAGLPGKGYAKILKEKWTGITPSGAYWNPTEIVSDNRLAAFESDVSQYTFSLLQGKMAIVNIKLYYRRAFIELMDQKSWDSSPDILMQQLVIAVPA